MKGRYVIKKSRKFIVSLIIAVFLVGIFPANISTVTAMEKEINLVIFIVNLLTIY